MARCVPIFCAVAVTVTMLLTLQVRFPALSRSVLQTLNWRTLPDSSGTTRAAGPGPRGAAPAAASAAPWSRKLPDRLGVPVAACATSRYSAGDAEAFAGNTMQPSIGPGSTDP